MKIETALSIYKWLNRLCYAGIVVNFIIIILGVLAGVPVSVVFYGHICLFVICLLINKKAEEELHELLDEDLNKSIRD